MIESEATLWSTKVMNMDTPKGLLRPVILYVQWQLRGGAEQRRLEISQLCREVVQIGGKDVSSYVCT